MADWLLPNVFDLRDAATLPGDAPRSFTGE